MMHQGSWSFHCHHIQNYVTDQFNHANGQYPNILRTPTGMNNTIHNIVQQQSHAIDIHCTLRQKRQDYAIFSPKIVMVDRHLFKKYISMIVLTVLHQISLIMCFFSNVNDEDNFIAES